MECIRSSIRFGRALRLALCGLLLVGVRAHAQTDPLPSWNDGAAKQAIIAFVQATTDTSSPKFVPPEARIATSTRTARCGSRTRCTRRWSTAWSACRRS
jgi:hypothetical protein